MSVQATTAVWEHSSATGTNLIVLLAIADAANAEGLNAHPGLDKLVKQSRRGRSAVLRAIARLISVGELDRVESAHRGRATVFALRLPGLSEHQEKGGADAPLKEQVEGSPSATLKDDKRVASKDVKGRIPDEKGSHFERDHKEQQPVSNQTATKDLAVASLNGELGQRVDVLFESVAEVCGIDWHEVTESGRGALNKAVKDLRKVGASAAEVRRRAESYPDLFPDAAMTPSALARHWAQLANVPPRRPKDRFVDMAHGFNLGKEDFDDPGATSSYVDASRGGLPA